MKGQWARYRWGKRIPGLTQPSPAQSHLEAWLKTWDSMGYPWETSVKLQGRKIIPEDSGRVWNLWLIESLACIYFRLGRHHKSLSMNWISCGYGELSPGLSPIPGRPATLLALRAFGRLGLKGKSRGNSTGLPVPDLEERYPWKQWRLKTHQYRVYTCLPLSIGYAAAF